MRERQCSHEYCQSACNYFSIITVDYHSSLWEMCVAILGRRSELEHCVIGCCLNPPTTDGTIVKELMCLGLGDGS